MRVSYAELHLVLARALTRVGFEADRADLCARLFADTDRDGVYSHGLNRFPRFFRMIQSGVVDVQATPSCVDRRHAFEQWDGRRGPGNLNAHACMQRALALAEEYAVGCVALANTNHWMRGGSYGWLAADAGAIGMCWTNTLANLPPWGAREPRLGNNPLVIAIPRPAGHVVLDMAMSQFSVGGLASYRTRGESLPVDGGYDDDGVLTRDPAAIERTRRLLPIGFWKGSGLALVLDIVGAVLSGGLATHQISANPEKESDLSQVFIALRPPALGHPEAAAAIVDDIVTYTRGTTADGISRYPGERTLETRRQNLEEGIPVDPSVWEQVQGFASA
jgi:3-dehydro-L-gulonate 2-dehydrogenase